MEKYTITGDMLLIWRPIKIVIEEQKEIEDWRCIRKWEQKAGKKRDSKNQSRMECALWCALLYTSYKSGNTVAMGFVARQSTTATAIDCCCAVMLDCFLSSRKWVGRAARRINKLITELFTCVYSTDDERLGWRELRAQQPSFLTRHNAHQFVVITDIVNAKYWNETTVYCVYKITILLST